jgi:hypothetical protein
MRQTSALVLVTLAFILGAVTTTAISGCHQHRIGMGASQVGSGAIVDGMHLAEERGGRRG